MILIQQQDYGALGPLVGTVGSLLAAVSAIALAWRGRAKWEPSEEDVAKGPQKVGGLLAAVAIAIVWTQNNDPSNDPFLIRFAIALASICLISLCIYSFVIATQTYEIIVVRGKNRRPESQKVIGGFSLKEQARKKVQEKDLTVQELLKGSAYDPDRVWTRPSRALAKLVFVICYLGLTVSGTIAIACAAILLGHAQT